MSISIVKLICLQGYRSEVKSMEDEPPMVTDVGPAMFSSEVQ